MSFFHSLPSCRVPLTIVTGSSGSELTATSERDIIEELPKDLELHLACKEAAAADVSATTIPEGWRYFLKSGTVSFMGISLLAFFLTLTIWNTWRAITYVWSPLPEMIGLRCTMHIACCLFAVIIIVVGNRYCGSYGRGMKVLGNVLGGIGLWEMVESLVSYSTNVDPSIDLIIYAIALTMCSIMTYILYRWRNINIIDSSLLSPV